MNEVVVLLTTIRTRLIARVQVVRVHSTYHEILKPFYHAIGDRMILQIHHFAFQPCDNQTLHERKRETGFWRDVFSPRT